MARHFIYATPTAEGLDHDRRLELAWTRDGGVQLATTKWQGEAGKVDNTIDYLPVVSSGNPPLAWDGSYMELTRGQINHLIKQLRIARDQAFGRDE